MKATTMWKVWCVFPNWWNWWWASANNTDLAIRTQWQQQRWSSTWWLLLTRKQTKRQTDGCRTDGPCNRKSEAQFNVRSHTFLHTCMHTSVVFIYIYLYVGKEFRPSVCLTLFSSSSSSPTFVMLDGWIVGWNEWLVHWLLFVAWLLPANVVVIVWLFFCDSELSCLGRVEMKVSRRVVVFLLGFYC